VLFIGIPTYNEATTIGVLLWRLRTVLSDVSREYEVVVYDDASTDETTAVLEPYARVLPLTLLRGARRLGTGGAIDAIVRHVARTTRYPRRDGLLLMQGDFTDSPALVPEFLRRFEGGADLIIGERATAGDAPVPVRRLFAASRWVLRPFVGITDVRDLTSSFRLARITVLRDLLKASGDAPVASGDAWMAQADFLLRAAPHARRVETIPVTPTFGVRTRETRRTAWPDALALAKWGWSHRGRRIAAKVIARTVEASGELVEPAEVAEVERPERRERATEPVEKRGRRERGGERRERTETPEPGPRPPRPKRAAGTAAGATTSEAATGAGDEAAEPVESVEGDRGTRKRRRGKRGAKRPGEPLETGGEDAENPASAPMPPSRTDGESTTDAPPREADAEGVAGAAGAAGEEGPAGEERERKRRRARRGRRKRGEGRDAEGRDGEERDSEDRDGEHRASEHRDGREGDGREGEGREMDGRDGEEPSGGSHGADHGARAGEAADVSRSDMGDREGGEDAGPRRRNRRGRRGGRRRSGSGGSDAGAASREETGDTGPADQASDT